MPNETVEMLLKEVREFKECLGIFANDMIWVKRGVIGLYVFIGMTIASVAGAYFATR